MRVRLSASARHAHARARPSRAQLGAPPSTSAPQPSAAGAQAAGGGDLLGDTLKQFGMAASPQQAWADSLPKLGYLLADRVVLPTAPPHADAATQAALQEIKAI